MKPGFTYRDKAKHGKRNTFPQLYEAGLISIIAPCYNEAENIELFLSEVAALDIQPYRKEVILVNDGSRDGTGIIMERQKKIYPDLRTIHFTGNFGQQQALIAGIRAAHGEIIITLDVDLQQPPGLIPSMIRQYEMGFDAVYAIPEYQPNSAGWLKVFTSKMYYNLIKKLGASDVIFKSNDFRLISYRIAELLRNLPEHNLYLRGIIAKFCPVLSSSDRQGSNPGLLIGTPISYLHQPRATGLTKYSWLKMLRLAFDGLTATSVNPLRFGILLGLLSIVAAFFLSTWALYVHLTHHTVPGWTSLIIVSLFFFSIQSFMIGLLGEYIGKIFQQVRGRPGYIIQPNEYELPGNKKVNFQNNHQQKPISRDPILLKHGELVKTKHTESASRHPP